MIKNYVDVNIHHSYVNKTVIARNEQGWRLINAIPVEKGILYCLLWEKEVNNES